MSRHWHICPNHPGGRLWLCNYPHDLELYKTCEECLTATVMRETSNLDRYLEERGGCYGES